MENEETIKFTILLPIIREPMPEHIGVEKNKEGVLFIAKLIPDAAYKWNIYDEHDDIYYAMYTLKMLKSDDNADKDILIRYFLPTDLVEKVGLHMSYSCQYLPYIPVDCRFTLYTTSKNTDYFDHNVIDFSPKILINDPRKIKIFYYRPTFFCEIRKEINCLSFIEF